MDYGRGWVVIDVGSMAEMAEETTAESEIESEIESESAESDIAEMSAESELQSESEVQPASAPAPRLVHVTVKQQTRPAGPNPSEGP